MAENSNTPVADAADAAEATGSGPVASAGHVVKPLEPGEKTFALVMLLLGLTVLWLSYRISGFSGWSTAGSVPLGTSLVLTLAALRIVFATLKKPAAHSRPGDPIWHQFYTHIFPARHMLFTGVIILYMLTLEWLGFLLSSFLYMTLSSLVLDERRYVWMTVVNVLTLAAVYLVFQTAFSVVLPVGPIERIFQ